MSHLVPLISDLAMILTLAGLATILCKKLNQPLILGYMLAGFLASPHFSLLPNVIDSDNITVWSDIGVIFILFDLGLDYNFNKIKSTANTAIIAAVTEFTGIACLGFACAQLLGWSLTDSIFTGCMLTMSSTAVVSKTLGELNLLKQAFAPIAFGILVLEDISGIIMMVVLSTVAAAGSAISPLSMLESIGLLVFFFIICFIIGIYFLPTFFKKTRQYFNDETLLIVSLGLCLSMVVLASKMGFSSALGAFLMGTLLSGTIYTRRTKVLLEPVKNLFSGIFFVSVGMMVDPSVVSGSLFTIIALAITLITGKCIFTSLGVMLSGQPLKTSMRCGFSLTQLGEFAFIVANIGASYGLTSSFLYPVFVTVSVLTIFLTPHILLSTDKVYRRFLRRLPKKTAVMLIEAHRDNKNTRQQSDWKDFLQLYFTKITVYTVILIFISYIGTYNILPYCRSVIQPPFGDLSAAAVTLLFMSPFLAALMVSRLGRRDLMAGLWFKKRSNRPLILVLMFLKAAIGLFFIMQVFTTMLGLHIIIAIIAALVLAKFIYSSDYLIGRYLQIESQFLINLNAENLAAAAQKRASARHGMWLDEQFYTCAYEIQPGSPWIGWSIRRLDVHRNYKIFVIEISNQHGYHPIPSGHTVLRTGDKLLITAPLNVLQTFDAAIKNMGLGLAKITETVTLHKFLEHESQVRKEHDMLLCYAMPVTSASPLARSTLKKSDTLSKGKWLALGLERGDYTISDPDASFVINNGDILWIIGSRQMLSSLFRDTTL